MTLPINELCDYYLSCYPNPGDTLTCDDIAEDAKVLAAEMRMLREWCKEVVNAWDAAHDPGGDFEMLHLRICQCPISMADVEDDA